MGRDPESVQRQKTPQTQETIAAQSLETRGSSHSCLRERLQRMLVDSWRCLASLGASLAIGVNMEYLPNILCGCDANNSRSGVRERKMLTCAQRNVARLVERVLTHRFLGKAITPKRTNPRKWAIFWVSQTKEMVCPRVPLGTAQMRRNPESHRQSKSQTFLSHS
ncbi:uncharacterized protein CIMG_10553 [Coccidioides immitis RS]|uniref:Uncharacterized protein n=1 Tax=Coccidioides immitis (strain RS) TaxID=246410 RepID=A0A0D8JSQ0_COCIM|nr:uncharacterized protein CIMG_10553 [Coccidioides immitis RS]KJF60312.1 hypothetical protein CIMG_10553 [Coccidioides immitis RS]